MRKAMAWSRKHLLNKTKINDNQNDLFDGLFSPSCQVPSKSHSWQQPISYWGSRVPRSWIWAWSINAPLGGSVVCWCMESLACIFFSLNTPGSEFITEWFELERTLKFIQFQPLAWAGTPSTIPGRSKPRPTCPGHFQRRDSHNLPGQPVPGPQCLHRE